MECFDLHVHLNNDAMRTPADVANALRALAQKLDEFGDTGPGNVLDRNGNVVGGWGAIWPREEDDD